MWTTHTCRKVSTSSINETRTHLYAALRIEWCQARARANRWAEEVELIQEEMRRVLSYHGWMRDVWQGRCDGRPDLSGSYQEGLSAYAHRQAEIRIKMKDTCGHMWRFVQQWVDLGQSLTNSGTEVKEDGLDELSGLLTISRSVTPSE